MKKINLQKNNKAFVILFAVTISSILLAIALGVANIAFREVRFNTNAVATNNAFFAADTGVECALFYDSLDPAKNAFSDPSIQMNCAGKTGVLIDRSKPSFWSFAIEGLGDTGQGCVSVTVDKTNSPNTEIISKGYNTGGIDPSESSYKCSSSNPNRVERELKVNY